MKASARSLQPLVRIASRIWSWVCFHASTRSEASRGSARATARSRATQHISLEYKKSRGSPRTSQIPWSFSCQRRAAVSASWTKNRRVAGARSGGAPHLSGAAIGPTRGGVVEEVVREAVHGARAVRRRRRVGAGSRRRCRPARGRSVASPPGAAAPARSGPVRRRCRT